MTHFLRRFGLAGVLWIHLVACTDEETAASPEDRGTGGARGEAGAATSDGGTPESSSGKAGASSRAGAPGEGGAGGQASVPVQPHLGDPIHVSAGADAEAANGTEQHPFPSPAVAVAAIEAFNEAATEAWDGKMLVHEGRYEVEAKVTLPLTVDLEIEAGTTFAMGPDVGLNAQGNVQVLGTEEKPVLFTWLEEGKKWSSLSIFEETSQDNVFEYAIFEHGGEVTFRDVYMRGALSLYEASARVSHCTFRENEGDDGFAAKGSDSLIEYSTFVDNQFDDMDLDLESSAEVAYNTFEGAGNDAVDLGEGSKARIHDNVMYGAGDKGVSIGEDSAPTIDHNLMVGCGIGIGIKDASAATIHNNTIYACTVGISGQEAKEAGMGAGAGVVTDNIVWGSTMTDLNLAAINETDFAYNCIGSLLDLDGNPLLDENGDPLIDNDTNLTQEAGCEDPLFANPSTDPSTWDFHLKSAAGRYDPETDAWGEDDETSPCIDAGDPDADIGDEPDPNGGVINMGAYGGTKEASRSPEAG